MAVPGADTNLVCMQYNLSHHLQYLEHCNTTFALHTLVAVYRLQKSHISHDSGISITNTALAIQSPFLFLLRLKLKNIIFLTAYHATIAVHFTSPALAHTSHSFRFFTPLKFDNPHIRVRVPSIPVKV